MRMHFSRLRLPIAVVRCRAFQSRAPHWQKRVENFFFNVWPELPSCFAHKKADADQSQRVAAVRAIAKAQQAEQTPKRGGDANAGRAATKNGNKSKWIAPSGSKSTYTHTCRRNNQTITHTDTDTSAVDAGEASKCRPPLRGKFVCVYCNFHLCSHSRSPSLLQLL